MYFLFKERLKSCENLKRYLSHAKIHDDSEDFVFRRVTIIKSDNQILRKTNAAFSYSSARETILGALEAIGFNKSLFSTHSLRSGGATATATVGVPDRLCKRHGRGHSDR